VEMTKQFVQQLAREAEEALKAVAEKHGLTVRYAGGKYDPTAGTFTPKVEFANADSGQKKFEQFARGFGFTPEDYDAEFTTTNGTYRLVGLNPRAPKYPVLARNVRDGKTYKMPERIVLAAMGRPVNEPRRIEVL
jgi:hypothetical protein